MAGDNVDLIVKIAANIQGLQTGLAEASAAIKSLEGSVTSAGAAGAGFASILDSFNHPLETAKSAMSAFAGTLGPAGVELLGVGTAAVAAGAAFLELGAHAEEVGAQIARVAMVSGILAPAVSDLKFAFDATGGSIEQLSTVTFMLGQRMENSSSKVSTGLAMIGLSLAQIKAMSGDQQILAISDAFRVAGESTNKAAAAFDIFGRQGRELLPQLMMPLGDLVEKSKEIGNTWSEVDVAAAHEFELAVKTLATTTSSTWTALGRDVAPITDQITLAYERMKLAIANVAVAVVELGGALPALEGYLGNNALAAETAAAKLDTINKAISEGAPLAIKYADAVRYVATHMAGGPDSAAAAAAAWLEKLAETELAGMQANAAAADLTEGLARLGIAQGATAEDMKAMNDEYDKGVAAAAKFADVVAQLTAVGVGWQGTLDTIDGTVAESLKYYLQAGVAQTVLADAYALTAAQVKAVASELSAETAATKQAAEASLKAADAAKHWAEIMANLNSVGANTQQTIDEIDGSVVEAVKYYLAASVSQRELAEAYALTEAQIKAVASAMGQHGQAARAAGQSTQFCAEEIDAMTIRMGAAQAQADNWVTKLHQIQAGADAAAAANRRLGGSFAVEVLSEADLKKRYGSDAGAEQRLKDIQAYYASNPGAAAGGVGSTGLAAGDQAGWQRLLAMQQEFAALSLALSKTTTATTTAVTTSTTTAIAAVITLAASSVDAMALVSAAANALIAKSTGRGASGGLLDTGRALYDALNDQQAALYRAGKENTPEYKALLDRMRPLTPSSYYADGVQNAPGGWSMVGERGPEAMYVPKGADIYPHRSGASGGGMTIGDITINVNGSVLSTKEQLAAAVGEAFITRLRNLGVRFPTV